MTAVGWSALSSLSLEILSQADTLLEAFSFTNVAIPACAVVTALHMITTSGRREEPRGAVHARCRNDDETESVRALAAQMRCAESRARLLALTKRGL